MIAVKTIVWAVMTNTDLTEGRGHEKVLAYFRNQTVAKEYGKGQFVMGGNCPIKQVEVYLLDNGECFPVKDVKPCYENFPEDNEKFVKRVTERLGEDDKKKLFELLGWR